MEPLPAASQPERKATYELTDTPTRNLKSNLCWAAKTGTHEDIREVLDELYNTQRTGVDRIIGGAMRCAIRANNLDNLRYLLETHPHLFNEELFITLAIKAEDRDILDYLMSLEPSVMSLEAPLEYSVNMEDEEAVKYLLKHGAKPNSEILLAAARSGNENIVRALVDKGAQIREEDMQMVPDRIRRMLQR